MKSHSLISLFRNRCAGFVAVLAALCLALGLPSGARAAADDETKYRRAYNEALHQLDDENYDQAIRSFEAAYAIKPKPILLYNIARSHHRAGRYKDALDYYLRYRDAEPRPKPGLKTELERYISELKDMIVKAQEGSAGAAPGKKPDLQLAGEEPPPPQPKPLVLVIEPKPQPEPTAPAVGPNPAEAPIYKRGWFWGIVGGVVAASIVTGVAVGVTRDPCGGFDGGCASPFSR